MIAACSIKPLLLAQAFDRLRDDADVVLSAFIDDLVHDPIDVLKECSERLKGDELFLLKAIKSAKHSLKWLVSISSTLSIAVQRNILSAIAKQLPLLLWNVCEDSAPLDSFSELVRDEKAIMLPIIKFNGRFLKYCSDRLKSDQELATTAVESKISAVRYVLGSPLDAFTKDTELMKGAVQENPDCLTVASLAMKENRQVLLSAAGSDRLNPSHWPEQFRTDKEIVLKAASIRWRHDSYYEELVRPFREDADFALRIVKVNERVYEYLAEDLQRDERIAKKVFENTGFLYHKILKLAFENVPSLIQSRDTMMTLAKKMKRFPCGREQLCEAARAGPFTDDKEFVITTCQSTPEFIQHVSLRPRWDTDVVAAALVGYAESRYSENYFPLHNASTEYLLENLKILVYAIKVVKKRHEDYLYQLIPDRVLRKGEVVASGLRKGWNIFRRLRQQRIYCTNKKFIIYAARYSWREFAHVRRSLRCDRAFVLELVGYDPHIALRPPQIKT